MYHKAEINMRTIKSEPFWARPKSFWESLASKNALFITLKCEYRLQTDTCEIKVIITFFFQNISPKLVAIVVVYLCTILHLEEFEGIAVDVSFQKSITVISRP